MNPLGKKTLGGEIQRRDRAWRDPRADGAYAHSSTRKTWGGTATHHNCLRIITDGVLSEGKFSATFFRRLHQHIISTSYAHLQRQAMPVATVATCWMAGSHGIGP
ncbi:MAG: hypothetical protein K2X41_03825 [Hyphomicrobium sp.]|nr:hypothetical protein [Hyphomicrobium sp.]